MSSSTKSIARRSWVINCRTATGDPASLRLWATPDGGVAGTLPRGGFLLSAEALNELAEAITSVQSPDGTGDAGGQADTDTATGESRPAQEPGSVPPLTRRDREILHAAAAGRVECLGGSESDLYVDGLACCDQFAAQALVRAGLIAPAQRGSRGERVPVQLTTRGWEAINEPN